jgi:hypothetical protein
VGEFSAAAARGFDDDMDVAVFCKGRQVKKIGHGVSSLYDECQAKNDAWFLRLNKQKDCRAAIEQPDRTGLDQ